MTRDIEFEEYTLKGRSLFQKLAFMISGKTKDWHTQEEFDYTNRRGAQREKNDVPKKHYIHALPEKAPPSYQDPNIFWNQAAMTERQNQRRAVNEVIGLNMICTFPKGFTKEQQQETAMEFIKHHATAHDLGVTYSIYERMEKKKTKDNKMKNIVPTGQYQVEFLISTRKADDRGFSQQKHGNFIDQAAIEGQKEIFRKQWYLEIKQRLPERAIEVKEVKELGFIGGQEALPLSHEVKLTPEQEKAFDIPVAKSLEMQSPNPDIPPTIQEPGQELKPDPDKQPAFYIPVITNKGVDVSKVAPASTQPVTDVKIGIELQGLGKPTTSIFDNSRVANDNQPPIDPFQEIKDEIRSAKEQMQALAEKLQGLEQQLYSMERTREIETPAYSRQKEQAPDLLAGIYDKPTDQTRQQGREILNNHVSERTAEVIPISQKQQEWDKLMRQHEENKRRLEQERQDREQHPERYKTLPYDRDR